MSSHYSPLEKYGGKLVDPHYGVIVGPASVGPSIGTAIVLLSNLTYEFHHSRSFLVRKRDSTHTRGLEYMAKGIHLELHFHTELARVPIIPCWKNTVASLWIPIMV
jgi:hypothetical protein